MFSRPVNSGWKPVPTSNKLPTRPYSLMFPVVGSTMRERTFNRVDLPAPLRPMMPTTSPGFTSKLTSFNAHKAALPLPSPAGRRVKGARRALTRASRKVPYEASRVPMRYSLLRFSTLIIGCILLDEIGETLFHTAEGIGRRDQQQHGDHRRNRERLPVERPAVQ